jgi:hypothetical protein
MSDLNIPDAAYAAGEKSISGDPLAYRTKSAVASDVIDAAAPIILTAKLTEIVNRLEELRSSITNDNIYTGISAAIGIILGHIDQEEQL